MKITIDTADSHIYTDYLSAIPEDTAENAPDVSELDETAASADSSGTAGSEKSSFSAVFDAAIDAAAASKSAQQSAEHPNMKTLDEIFNEASATYGVDVNLLKAVGKAESSFDAGATSKSGAMGVMQLMPQTAADLGVNNAYDPYENIMGGARLLSSLLSKYNGDLSLALAAYNAGGSAVDKYGGIPPFEETQNYVPKVIGYYNEGVSIPDDKNLQYPGMTNYTATADSLKNALSEFSQHESYDLFLKELENELNKAPADNQTIYESLMSAASRALTTTMESYQQNQ